MTRKEITNLLEKVIGDRSLAEMSVDVLVQEGVLHVGFGEPDIDKIIEAFKSTFGTTKASRYDRFAAKRLAEKYGSQAICGIIQLLANRSGDKYAPMVNSVSQLEEKIVNVLRFLRDTNGEVEVIDA